MSPEYSALEGKAVFTGLLLASLVAIGLAVAFVGQDSWRIGCLIVGSSLAVGAVERLALPAGEAGLLQVRSKVFDIAFLTLAGGAVIALAILVPAGR